MTKKIDQKNSRIPTVFVVLGVTGDLTAKKIAPALFNLYEKKMLPAKFQFVGVSRRDWGDAELREHIRAILHVKAPHASEASIEKFLKLVTYGKIRFDTPGDYEVLNDKLRAIDDKMGMCSNKLFYLSVPPEFYDGIFDNLHKSGLAESCGPDEGWTRVVVEKPFGNDEQSAKELDEHLARLFNEEQIYRIDHYLAKEMLQNILAFRFGNNLFEREWGAETIEAINIKLYESIGAEDRGSFYENVGALRDVGQNHLLQMLALVTMERPGASPDSIREARANLLEQLVTPSVRDAAKNSFRAQYDGYRSIKGVAPKSEIETYFRVRGFLSGERWEGVPVAMESGKRLGKPQKEIEIVFRAEPNEPKFKNRIIIHLEPKEGITITFISKKPGHTLAFEERSLSFDFRESERDGNSVAGHGADVQYVAEYEKLILDCIAGDQTLFVSSEEIRAMWRFTDPFITAWAKNLVPLKRYAPDSAAIAVEATVLMDQQARQSHPQVGAASINRVIGLYGLGKMGAGLARNMRDHGWRVVVANRSPEPVAALEAEGFEGARTTDELLEKISPSRAGGAAGATRAASRSPRVVWLMITAGKPVDEFLFGKNGLRSGSGGLAAQLRRGDIVIDGGNSFFEDSSRRAKLLARRGIKFLDAGVSGGPAGARNGACMMVGGDRAAFDALEELFAVTCVSGGYGYFGSAGAGHFVKMVHNGIEYGMMQSLAEGFTLMRRAPFKLDLARVAHLYNHGSVIESRLVGWMESAYKNFGQELKNVSSSVAYTGEGEWTVRTGKKWKMKLPAIEDSFKFRVASGAMSSKKSKRSPGDIYMGKILSALRNQFGGHSIEKK
jgi:glucose-6-phosphate 1-dehydrogenase